MTLRRTLQSSPARPELDRLIEEASKLPPMTPEQLREQRISFTFGNCSLDNPNITREMVERIHDEQYGIIRNPDLAFVRSELQKVRGILDGIERWLDGREAA